MLLLGHPYLWVTLSWRILYSGAEFSENVFLLGDLNKDKLLDESNIYFSKLPQYEAVNNTEFISPMQLKTDSIIV